MIIYSNLIDYDLRELINRYNTSESAMHKDVIEMILKDKNRDGEIPEEFKLEVMLIIGK